MTSSPARKGPAIPGAAQLQRSTGHLATAATTRMDDDLPWFRALPAQERSWVGLMVQAGIQGFVQWYAAGGPGEAVKADLAATIFGAAPRAMAGAITLQQTVDLVRLSIDVVESSLDDLLDPDDVLPARAGVSRYAREVAFATAEVYARADKGWLRSYLGMTGDPSLRFHQAFTSPDGIDPAHAAFDGLRAFLRAL